MFFRGGFSIFFLLGYIMIFIVAIIIIRPFRKHKQRLISTILLKLSYLFFLALFLVITYLLLFGNKNLNSGDNPYNSIFHIHSLLLLIAAVIPNAGIAIRKRVKKNRASYNIIFTMINLVLISYLLNLLISGRWMWL